MISPGAVLALLDELSELGATAWLDGGWGIDALLGEQTREHDDVDLVIHRADVRRVRGWLTAQGYEVERDWLPTALALRHPDGRGVDLHPVDPTPEGGGDQVLSGARTFGYDPPVTGRISGRSVPCCSADTQVRTHLGYEPDADDRADMARLVERFGVSWPG